MNLNHLTIIEALDGLKKRRFSAVELTQACLDQIKRLDSKIKAFITVCNQEALAAARKADQELKQGINKPLLGIPVAIKDNFCTQGIKTTASSRVLENYIPVYDATVVVKLQQAGAVVLGKTNMDAWAHGSSTETSDFFTSLNPWNPACLPGGSSGGSAAAVAAGETIFAIGSETAGSIRQPAAWCGITGLKPTYGRVSRYGVIAMASSTDSPGPLTKTAADAGLVLQVLAGNDPKDATSAVQAVPDYSQVNQQQKIVIGIPQEYFLDTMDPEVVATVNRAIKEFQTAGFEFKKVNLLAPKYAVAVYTIIQRSEVSSNLARYDGIRYGNSRKSFGKEAKNRIMLGTYNLSSGFYDQYYNKAQKVRTLICQDFIKVFNRVDLLLAPTSPTPALPIGASEKSPMFGELQDILVEASSMAGLPGINLPCGFSKGGLPIGMQLIGPQFSEKLLLQVGHQYQQLTDWHQVKCKI